MNCRTPDIQLHDPHETDCQVFAVEVKRSRPNYKPGNGLISGDLGALSEYVTDLCYYHGFFIGLGTRKQCLDAAIHSRSDHEKSKARDAAYRITAYFAEDGPRESDDRLIERY